MTFTYQVMPANLPQQATLLSVDLLQQSLQVVAALHLYVFVEQSKTHQSITHRQSGMAQCVWNYRLEKWLPLSGPLLHSCTPRPRRDVLRQAAVNPWLDLQWPTTSMHLSLKLISMWIFAGTSQSSCWLLIAPSALTWKSSPPCWHSVLCDYQNPWWLFP